jgi:hypothetical protein
MSRTVWSRYQDQELPSLTFEWYERDENNRPQLLDLSDGYSFTAEVVDSDNVAQVTIANSQCTGTSTAPNLTVTPESDAFLNLDPGTYTLRITAREAASGLDLVFGSGGNEPLLKILATPTS